MSNEYRVVRLAKASSFSPYSYLYTINHRRCQFVIPTLAKRLKNSAE